MIEADLRLRAVVPAPPKTVYEVLTDPAALRVWLAEHADVELPGRYEFWGRYTPDGAEPHQRVLYVDERTIRFAWTVDGVETTVQFELDPGGARFVEFEPGHKATLRFADGMIDSWELEGSDGKTRLTVTQSGFDPANPPYPGWAGWLGGLAALRRYHELPQWRPIWRHIEIAGVPEGMFSTDQ